MHGQSFKIFVHYLCHFQEGGHSRDQGVDGMILEGSDIGNEDGNWVQQALDTFQSLSV
jgi:hypothetical protein